MARKKETPDSDSCASCAHWAEQTESQDEIRWGLCRAHPPTPTYTADDDAPVACVVAWTELPFVCGELKRVLQ